jgi:hypothetical protein
MKKIIANLIVAAFTVFIVTGCVSTNPDKSPGSPQFVISPALSNAQDTVHAITPAVQSILAVTPAAPAAPFIPSAADTVMGIIVAASAWFANKKNKDFAAAQASSDSHAAAAAALAATVVNLNSPTVPAIGTAISNAAANGSSAAVASHLAAANNPVQL